MRIGKTPLEMGCDRFGEVVVHRGLHEQNRVCEFGQAIDVACRCDDVGLWRPCMSYDSDGFMVPWSPEEHELLV